MGVIRPSRYLPNHPLAVRNGKVAVSRIVLYDKLEGGQPSCHWCGSALTWVTVCADHLDSDHTNNVPENLVPACRGCNANREDGTGHGRQSADPRPCAHCGQPFLALRNHRHRQRYCGQRCANLARGPRGTKTLHGTEGRYKYGCRCDLCRRAHADAFLRRKYGHAAPS